MEKWKQLFQEIQSFNYVVQRNWEPDDKHDDLDLFVSNEDYKAVKAICDKYELIDLRTPGDGYYPEEIEDELLDNPRFVDGMKVPSLKAHFLSLYYHNAVHKQGNPYGEKLRKLFLEIYKPVRCQDAGVEYYV